jgi:DNA polymerase (family 10)
MWQAKELETIAGVGKALAEKIGELLSTGELEFYDRLIKEVPESLLEILEVPDIGPKRVARFWKELGITNIGQLEQAARNQQLKELPGFGERSETRILRNIELMKSREVGRISIGDAWPLAESLIDRLRLLPEVKEAQVAGSLRRMKETVGDLDLVVATDKPEEIIQKFLTYPEIDEVTGQGKIKVSVRLKMGLNTQLWLHSPEHFGAALQYATGSQAHNVRLREVALKQKLSLSEYGFTDEGGEQINCPEERDVYQTLGLNLIAPELREDRGEIAASMKGLLPNLISEEDIQGEIHAHSDWSDGLASIREMAEAAINWGVTYLVISDHSRSLGVANGLTIERLHAQRKAIDEVQSQIGDEVVLLQGTEVEVRTDGSLDYPDDVLAELDFVVASVHSSLRQPREKVTGRFLAAIENPHVDLIGHLSGRLIGRRDPADLDIELILKHAAKHGVAMEINAHPDRLDLNENNAKRAIELGCMLAITTDAHHPDHFQLRKYGIGIARRAWVTRENVINCWDSTQFLEWIQLRGN